MNVNLRLLLCILLFAFLWTGCSDHFVGPGSPDEPEVLFDLVWNEFDRYYPFFLDKNVDWDSVYTVYRPRVSNTMSDEALFGVLTDMLASLRDGHVNLYTPFGTASYTGWYDQYPGNFFINIIINSYLRNNERIAGGGNILYGVIGSTGYILIRSFSGEGQWTDAIDEVIEELQHLDGIIVDVRNNGGGSGSDAKSIARRFADRKRVFAFTQFRNGPSHADFTGLEEKMVGPGGNNRYHKPVVLLTNRSTYSAAEDFTLMMKKFPHVTHIGDTTGGGLGNPVFRELPNGWGYRLSVWRQVASDMSEIEGIGIAPDMQVDITPADFRIQADTILERALEYLNN